MSQQKTNRNQNNQQKSQKTPTALLKLVSIISISVTSQLTYEWILLDGAKSQIDQKEQHGT